MNTLKDTIELRAARIKAYKLGQYKFNPPPVFCGNWNAEAWHNHVKFNDESLTGFIDYDEESHKKAVNLLPVQYA